MRSAFGEKQKKIRLVSALFLCYCVEVFPKLSQQYKPVAHKKKVGVSKRWLKPSKHFKPREGITEKRLVVVVASYNNKDWYRYNLASIFAQKYSNCRIIYIDDCSSDGTAKLVKKYIRKRRQEERVTLLENSERRTKTANMYRAIHMCDDDEIIVVLDGDDWFANCDVLSYINELYTDNDIWMTYGGFRGFPSGKKKNYCREIPQEVVQERSFRTMRRITAAQRTFYAWLYKQIKLEDLLYEGKFMPTTGDVAKMYPMFEMAGHRFKYITDPVYIYNLVTPINDFKVHKKDNLQMKIHWFIVDKPKYDFLQESRPKHKYKNNVDLFLIAHNQEKLEKQLESIRVNLKGIHKIYVLSEDEKLETHNEKIPVLLTDQKNPLSVCSELAESSEFSDFILMLHENDHINGEIDLRRCARLLQQTAGVGFYFGLHADLFSKEQGYEEIENNIFAWQFVYGPSSPSDLLGGVLLRRDDIARLMAAEEKKIFSSEQIGLFFNQQAITVKTGEL